MERLVGAVAGFLAGLVFGALVGVVGFILIIFSGILATTGESFLVSAYEGTIVFAILAPFLTIAYCTFMGWFRKWRFFSFGRPT